MQGEQVIIMPMIEPWNDFDSLRARCNDEWWTKIISIDQIPLNKIPFTDLVAGDYQTLEDLVDWLEYVSGKWVRANEKVIVVHAKKRN